MNDNRTCPKCNGAMKQGKIMKRNEYSLNDKFLYVFAPDDEAGPTLAGKSAGRKGLVAYCCEQCGFVEFYGQSIA